MARVAFTRCKMVRAASEAAGTPVPAKQVIEEMLNLDEMWKQLPADSKDFDVLAEHWELADEALLRVAVLEASSLSSSPPSSMTPSASSSSPAFRFSNFAADLDGGEEVRKTLESIRQTASTDMPWLLDRAQKEVEILLSSSSSQQMQQRPQPTPCRIGEAGGPRRVVARPPRQQYQQPQHQPHSELEGQLQPPAPMSSHQQRQLPQQQYHSSLASSASSQTKGGSREPQSKLLTPGGFRKAADLPRSHAKPPPATGQAEVQNVNFDAVSKSILAKGRENSGNGNGNGGGGAASASASSARGAGTQQRKRKADQGEEREGREWSEDWLRIADAEQLDRIVPALEATIHKEVGASSVTSKDIAGLKFVKSQIEEVLILPRLHPQLFASSLTRPARGLLLFGPPGTGKTLLARWIASECGATFFNINASTVLSKWIGEAEKTVKALFQLASERQPSVIFIDEVDSLLSRRQNADNESSRRVKNEFLTSLEGADSSAGDKVLLVGATNMPWDLDDAVLRRLPKRLYVPLPGKAARLSLLRRQLAKHNEKTGLAQELTDVELQQITDRTEGFSGSDLQTLLQEAAMGPVREASAALLASTAARKRRGAKQVSLNAGQLAGPRNIQMKDFACALGRVRATFQPEQAQQHRKFNESHGTCLSEEAFQDDDSDDDDDDDGEEDDGSEDQGDGDLGASEAEGCVENGVTPG